MRQRVSPRLPLIKIVDHFSACKTCYTLSMALLPLPSQLEFTSDRFQLTPETVLQADQPNRPNAEFLARLLRPATNLPLPIVTGETHPTESTIRFALGLGPESLGEEGYQLEVRAGLAEVTARTPAGVFHGLQTLRQLLPVELESVAPAAGVDWNLPGCQVTDAPRFAWRAFMLDEARHFHGKQTVLKLLDLLALFKLNVFHWHLTDDQGWRVEIKKYPRLTEIGAHRPGTSRSFSARKHDGRPHGGFYTQAEIREIVAYAAERHITVIPEIELPGHSRAALASYPELSCTGGPFEVATRFGIFEDIYCAGKEASFQFLQAVLDEILDLFPAPYIHIGGDEAPKKRWKTCPDCQQRIRTEGLKDEHDLRAYFTNRIIHYLESHGRRAIGWNEILGPGLSRQAVVQFWLGDRKALLKTIRNDKRQAIMSNYLDAYLDHSYDLMPLSRAYNFEPVPAELEAAGAGCILGLEFPLWGEWLPNRARLDYQAFPRLLAMAETGWTPEEQKSLSDFRLRLTGILPRLDRLGVRYAPLDQVEPSRLRQWLGSLTIPKPQTKTAY
jgi:hexosaminidase